jgi:hypothetical protein
MPTVYLCLAALLPSLDSVFAKGLLRGNLSRATPNADPFLFLQWIGTAIVLLAVVGVGLTQRLSRPHSVGSASTVPDWLRKDIGLAPVPKLPEEWDLRWK